MPGCRQLLHFPSGAAMSGTASIHPPVAGIFRPAQKKLAMLTVTEEELPPGPFGDDLPGPV